MSQTLTAVILGAVIASVSYLAITPFRPPRWLLRLAEQVPAPRWPRSLLRRLERTRWPRLFKRGGHHADPKPMKVRLTELIHGTRTPPEDYQLSAFPEVTS